MRGDQPPSRGRSRISPSRSAKATSSIARSVIGIATLLFVGTFTLTVHGTALVALLASGASSVNDATTTLFLTPHVDSLAVGETADIDVNISTKIPINAVGITLAFPQDSIEIVGINKANSFIDLWTEDTAIKESTGEVHFSGGTTRKDGLLGSGTALTLTVKAKKPVSATLDFKAIEIYPHDGSGREVVSESRALTFDIVEQPPPDTAAASSGPAQGSYAPSADLDGNGRVTVVDLSVLMFRIIGGYNPRFDLNLDGSLGIADISVLLAQMTR